MGNKPIVEKEREFFEKKEDIKIQNLFICSINREKEIQKKIYDFNQMKDINESLIISQEKIRDMLWNEGTLNKLKGLKTKIHQFPDDSVKALFTQPFASPETFKSHSQKLVVEYSETGRLNVTLIFMIIQFSGYSFLVIFIYDYLENLHERSDIEMKDIFLTIFPDNIQKGLVYPYIVDGIVYKDEVKVFQKYEAVYWQESFSLGGALSNNQVINILYPVQIKKLAICKCKGKIPPRNLIRVMTIHQLRNLRRGNQLENIFMWNIAGTLEKNGILSCPYGKHAQIHNFQGNKAKQYCDDILHPKVSFISIKDEMKYFKFKVRKLIRLYKNTLNSRGAALFFFLVELYGQHFIVIYSSEYLEDIAQISSQKDQLIDMLEDVFSRDIRKGIIYPYLGHDKSIHEDGVKIFQSEYYATYWWEFFDLKKITFLKESLNETIKKIEENVGKEIIISQKTLEQIYEINGDVKNTMVTLTCDGIKISCPLSKLYTVIQPRLVDGNKEIVIDIEDLYLEISKGNSREILFH